MRARRALLYVPGDDMHKIRKATLLGVDCICMDLEDGVAQNRKAEARETILEASNNLDFGCSERLVRINPIGSGLEIDDLKMSLETHPDGIVVPKITGAEQVQWVCSQIDQKIGKDITTRLIVIIESAQAILNLNAIASADPRLVGLIFGAEDFAADIGATRTPQAWEVFYARSAIVTHAAAYHLHAIDMVFVDFKDQAGLRQESLQGAQMGFAGKQIIHPNQVAPVQEAFSPSDAEITKAFQVVSAFEEHQKAGRGAFAMDGKMVDAPIIRVAQRILERARAAGLIPAGDDSNS